ncbi:hypothetical protein ACFWB0_01510 [Rhodococcus sp. NPDC060086]
MPTIVSEDSPGRTVLEVRIHAEADGIGGIGGEIREVFQPSTYS